MGFRLWTCVVWEDSADYRSENRFLLLWSTSFCLFAARLVKVSPGVCVYVRWHCFHAAETSHQGCVDDRPVCFDRNDRD